MIEVGEYIRIKKGYIIKITECLGKDAGYKNMEHYEVDYYIPYRGFKVYEEDIKAHSKNIIDLIEVGDIIQTGEITIFTNVFENKENLDYFKSLYKNDQDVIKAILTHEQYEQNCYKVGDIE